MSTTRARAYPFNAGEGLDLDPLYAQLRAEEPLARVQLPHGEPAWLATRYEDARVVLGDARFSRAAVAHHDEPRMRPKQRNDGLLAMDPPDHTRLRRLVAKAFTARRVERLRPRTQEVADRLVGRMRSTGPPADLVEDFALPLPITVICGSANRDEQAFPGPERFDVHREGPSHLGFGHGPHHCLGAQLARMELQVALATLLEHLPGMRVQGAVEWKSGLSVRSPRRMPLTWQDP